MAGKTIIKYLYENYFIYYIVECPLSARFCTINEEVRHGPCFEQVVGENS